MGLNSPIGRVIAPQLPIYFLSYLGAQFITIVWADLVVLCFPPKEVIGSLFEVLDANGDVPLVRKTALGDKLEQKRHFW